jgi:hypothetical protein
MPSETEGASVELLDTDLEEITGPGLKEVVREFFLDDMAVDDEVAVSGFYGIAGNGDEPHREELPRKIGALINGE